MVLYAFYLLLMIRINDSNDTNFKGLNLTSQRLAQVYKSFKSRTAVIGHSAILNRLVSSANNLMLLFYAINYVVYVNQKQCWS